MLKIPFLSDEQDLVCSEGFQTLFRYIRDIAQLLSISYVPVPFKLCARSSPKIFSSRFRRLRISI